MAQGYRFELMDCLNDLRASINKAIAAAADPNTKLWQMQEHLDSISFKADTLSKSKIKDF